MNYFSMFSGIGGFEYGIQNSNKNNKLNCIGYSEVDKYAESIYKKHYPNHKGYGDARKIKTTELPDIDLLVGGFPCPSFSLAGKRQGFDDERGELFFEIARILKDKRPRYFLLENVRGLLSNKQGKTFQTILGILTNLGYHVEWQILNSKNFNVPQNRERVYIVGHFGGKCSREVFPITKGNGESRIKTVIDGGHQSNKVRDCKGLAPTLCAKGDNGFIHVPVNYGRRSAKKEGLKLQHKDTSFKIKSATKKGFEIAHRGDGICLDTPGKYRRGRVASEGTNTLLASGFIGTIDSERIRRLTPLECERLQGFPDDWTKFGVDGELISDSQRYKCCGNAVTTNVITYIFNEWDF